VLWIADGSHPCRIDGIVSTSKDPRDSHLHHAEGLTAADLHKWWAPWGSNPQPTD